MLAFHGQKSFFFKQISSVYRLLADCHLSFQTSKLFLVLLVQIHLAQTLLSSHLFFTHFLSSSLILSVNYILLPSSFIFFQHFFSKSLFFRSSKLTHIDLMHLLVKFIFIAFLPLLHFFLIKLLNLLVHFILMSDDCSPFIEYIILVMNWKWSKVGRVGKSLPQPALNSSNILSFSIHVAWRV